MIEKKYGVLLPQNAPFLRTAYNYDMNAASNETALVCPEKTLTQQQFAEECDINNLVERYKISGQLPVAARQPLYEDFDGVYDYQTALNAVRAAEESFAEMPAKVRNRFDNDPGRFVDFVNDPENMDEARKLGLITKPLPQPTPPPAPPAPPKGEEETTKGVT